MKIQGKGPGPTPAERLTGVKPAETTETSRKAAEGKRSDSVEISAAGRAKSGATDSSTAASVAPVPAERADRLELIRERVRSGFYETEEVQYAVAREIVARGEHNA
jgi:hypothetical protein